MAGRPSDSFRVYTRPGSACTWLTALKLVISVLLIKVTTGTGRNRGMSLQQLWRPARAAESVCLKLVSLDSHKKAIYSDVLHQRNGVLAF